MARERSGPRQPLSQARPKAAQGKSRATPGAAGVPAGGRGSRRGHAAGQAPVAGAPPRKHDGPARSPTRHRTRAGDIESPAAPPARRDASAHGVARLRSDVGVIESTPTGGPPPSGKGSATRARAPKRRSARDIDPRPHRRLAPARERAPEIYIRLEREYPDAKCALDHRDAYELLVATILSAQCTDVRVNMVTPALFARFPNAAALADASQEELEELIRSTGFFRSKAKSLLGMARALVERHGAMVPPEMDALTKLSGVGRKTANVILGNAFDLNEGVVVDTHVTRLANRLGFTRHADAVKIEQDLMKLFPRETWTQLSHLLIFHGRTTCVARNPRCESCVVSELCPSSRV